MRLPFIALLACILSSLALAQHDPSGPATRAVQASLDRIALIDARYSAVIATNGARALAAAGAQDALPAPARAALPLAGRPVLLKDNIESRELPTTAGSLALVDNHTDRDAPLVAGLREAGAIIIGKTNLSEWANFRSLHSISGWSAVGGQTRNAVAPDRSPCGSSSGSAVAVALGYVAIAIGTETSGSIICPAAVNGVVGVKPTHGLIAGAGIVPLASSQDTAGPIAVDVTAAALALRAMADRDNPRAGAVVDGLGAVASLADPGGLRIGVLANSTGYDRRRDRQLTRVLATLEAGGATIIEGLRVDPYDGYGDDVETLLRYEFRRDLNAYLAGLPNTLAGLDLEALIAFNEAHSAKELRYFGQEIFLEARDLELSEADYEALRARVRRAARDDGLDRLFTEHHLDALAGVSSSLAWLIDEVNGDAFYGPGMASLPATAGNPHVTLPLGTIAGLPLGISLVGERYGDHELLRLAHWLERTHRISTGN
ncbi:amidase family protein [Pseudohaliea rubra]|uniref:Amidotransferase-related protein n=1 Tax=Pseudohaliea rubra DSM 19751 TaxID=1265313 RepID=A0A095VNZ7_9GAMM|nr:amidase family protein [Pseudohaliea rubra]KGE03182.1 amidotransferase-related protein [Pseudohaliea rubra DSM 19751]